MRLLLNRTTIIKKERVNHVNGYLDAALILSVVVNVGAVFVLIKMYKLAAAIPVQNNDEIYKSMEEFIENMEKESDELFQNMTNYIKVKESEFDEKLRLVEEKRAAPAIVQAAPETVPAKMPEETGHGKVEKLYKQGFSPAQIAKVLKIELGQVELIINMLKKKQSYQQ